MINKYLLEKKMSFVFSVAVFIFALLPLNLQAQELIDLIIKAFKETEIARAKIYLNSTPVNVTDAHCERVPEGYMIFILKEIIGGQTQRIREALINNVTGKQTQIISRLIDMQ